MRIQITKDNDSFKCSISDHFMKKVEIISDKQPTKADAIACMVSKIDRTIEGLNEAKKEVQNL